MRSLPVPRPCLLSHVGVQTKERGHHDLYLLFVPFGRAACRYLDETRSSNPAWIESLSLSQLGLSVGLENLRLLCSPQSRWASFSSRQLTSIGHGRRGLATMKTDRISFLEKNATDAVIASAIFTAPAFLTGLNDTEVALVKRKVGAARLSRNRASQGADG